MISCRVVIAGCLVACGGGSTDVADDAPPGRSALPCAQRTGTWRLTAVVCEGVLLAQPPDVQVGFATNDAGTLVRTASGCTATTDFTVANYQLHETGSFVTLGFGQRSCGAACTSDACMTQSFAGPTVELACERSETTLTLEHAVSPYVVQLGGLGGCAAGEYEVAMFGL